MLPVCAFLFLELLFQSAGMSQSLTLNTLKEYSIAGDGYDFSRSVILQDALGVDLIGRSNFQVTMRDFLQTDHGGYDFTQSVLLRDTLGVDLNGNGLFDPGDTIRYITTITNAGTGNAPQIVFFLDEFNQADFVLGSVVASRGTILTHIPGVAVRANIVTPGEVITISFDAVLQPGAAGFQVVQGRLNVLLNDTYLSDDPDTGTAQDPTVTPIGGPDFQVTLRDTLGVDHNGNGLYDPGDRIHYEAALTNVGLQSAVQTLFVLANFDQSIFVPGSVITTHGTVLSNHFVRVRISNFLVGETITITFDADLAPDANQNTVQGVLEDEISNYLYPSDDPDTVALLDPTETPIEPGGGNLMLFATLTDILSGDHDGNGVPSIGDGLTLLAEIENLGSQTISGAIFRLAIVTNISPLLGSATGNGTVIQFTPTYLEMALDPIPPGGLVTVVFDSDIVAAGAFEHQASIMANGIEIITDDPETVLAVDPTVTVAVASVPTMSGFAFGLFAVVLLVFGILSMRKRGHGV